MQARVPAVFRLQQQSTVVLTSDTNDDRLSKPAQHMISWACVFNQPTVFSQLPQGELRPQAFLHTSCFRSVGRTANDQATMTGLVSRRTRPSFPNFPRTGTLTPGWYYSTAMTGWAGTNLQYKLSWETRADERNTGLDSLRGLTVSSQLYRVNFRFSHEIADGQLA